MPRSVPAIELRLPPTPTAESFVTSPAPLPQRKEVATTRKRKGVVARADGSERRRITVYIPTELGTQLGVWCAREGVDMSAAVTEALQALVGEPRPAHTHRVRE